MFTKLKTAVNQKIQDRKDNKEKADGEKEA